LRERSAISPLPEAVLAHARDTQVRSAPPIRGTCSRTEDSSTFGRCKAGSSVAAECIEAGRVRDAISLRAIFKPRRWRIREHSEAQFANVSTTSRRGFSRPAADQARKPRLRCVLEPGASSSAHVGDGNLHYNVGDQTLLASRGRVASSTRHRLARQVDLRRA
jgi:hypothetical protein